MNLKKVQIILCEACLNGDGAECHTPGCALFLHDSPGYPIGEEMYDVIDQWDVKVINE